MSTKSLVIADLVQLAADAALAVDCKLRVVAWNRRAEELLGYREREVQGLNCWTALGLTLLDGTPLCTPDCAAMSCFGRCLPYAAHGCRCRHRDGHWVELDLSSITVPNRLESDGVLAILLLRPRHSASVAMGGGDEALRVFTLGRFSLSCGERPIDTQGWERKQSLMLLKYLVTHRGRPAHKEQIVEALWPNVPMQQALGRLKVLVHFLRQQLHLTGVVRLVIETRPASYMLRPDSLRVDADVFESLVQRGEALDRGGDSQQALACFRDADAVYRGDYLEEEPYADWCVAERERLRERYLGLLERMADLCARAGSYEQAVHLCRKALLREPCREGVHRALMAHLWRLGRRDEAIAQFRACANTLARELAVRPSRETEFLYQQILRS